MSDVARKVADRWYLQPRLGAETRRVDPLLVWWALLYGLSSLARYHPERWVAALNVDQSSIAVDLEETLRLAERTLPSLIASALGGPGDVPRALMRQALEENLARSNESPAVNTTRSSSGHATDHGPDTPFMR
jgi:hypothetical protein